MLSIIDRLCENGHSILVGDCSGVDRLVQEHLAHKSYDKVTVFASGSTVRNNAGGFPVCMVDAGKTSGFEFYRKKDREMAERSAPVGALLVRTPYAHMGNHRLAGGFLCLYCFIRPANLPGLSCM